MLCLPPAAALGRKSSSHATDGVSLRGGTVAPANFDPCVVEHVETSARRTMRRIRDLGASRRVAQSTQRVLSEVRTARWASPVQNPALRIKPSALSDIRRVLALPKRVDAKTASMMLAATVGVDQGRG